MKRSSHRRLLFFPLSFSLLGCVAASCSAQTGTYNAALARYGARVTVSAPDKNTTRDPQTPPDALLDGNPHTRFVMRGPLPYTLTVTLTAPLPLDRIAFADSDYASERAPKDVEIRLDDGPPMRQTLELKRPEKRKPAWQEVNLGGKTAKVVTITVLSNHEPSATVNWGGLGEFAIWTTTNLDTRFVVPADATPRASFVHPPEAASGRAAAMPIKVTLPPIAAPGEHPRLLLTRGEVTSLKADLAASPRGQATLQSFLGVAEGTLKAPIDFPDPKGPPGQLKDRGDDVARRHDRLALNAGTLGMAYTLTGKKEYADRAAEILRGYAERYESYPEHKGVNKNDTGKVMGQRLSEAMWLIPLIEAFDYIYDSGSLTAEDKKRVETGLIRPAITFIRLKDPAAEAAARTQANPNWRTDKPPKGGASNWLLFYNAATMMAGAVLDDVNMRDLAAADLRRLISNGIGDDGMWDEGAIGYQFFALSALIGGVETAARQNIDLWSWDNARLKMMFDSPLRYAYPDGTAPGINDSSRAKLGDWSTSSYDYAYLRYGKDPAYGYLVNASPRQLHFSTAFYFPTRVYPTLAAPPAAAFPSTVFGDLGYAILRGPQTYALLDYGPHGGVHGHYDKLNLILFAAPPSGAGDEMGGEPRFHRYEDVLHDEWTVQTVAHNTLTVDETSQTASEGRLTVFEDAGDIKVLRGVSTMSAPGALLDRTVVVLPDAVLDLFHGHSGFSRTWDRTLRFQGTLQGIKAFDVPPPALGTHNGYQHIHVAEKIAASNPNTPWRGTWDTKAGLWTATVAGATGQQVITALGPDSDNLALARQTGDQADFAVAYTLDAWKNPAQSFRVLSTGNSDLYAAELTQQDGTKTTLVVARGAAGPWSIQGWKSDARVLCVRQGKNGAAKLVLAGGTFAEGADGSVRRDRAGNIAAERRAGKWEVVSAWTPPDSAATP